MNKIVLIAIVIGMISCSEKKPVTNNESNKEINKTVELTQIEFDSEMHDFGQVKSGEILSYSFVFDNIGKADLTIKNAEADCGCLEISVPKEPVKPGKRGIIEVEFNSAGMVGKQLKTVEIQSNSKEPKHLIIFAEVENEQIDLNIKN
jgi:Protein of unknown function (DUF1573)